MSIDELEFKRWFRRIVADSGEKIQASTFFLSIFTDNFKQSPQCALELGIAVMLDKPIYLLAAKGTTVSPVLKKLASGIEFFEPGENEKASITAAMARLQKKMANV